MTTPAPFLSSAMTVKPEWIDYNGHLNMAYYNVLFDKGADEVYEVLGFGPDYARTRKLTTYTAEFHICYVRELHEGDRVRVSFQMLDHNDRSFHCYQELHHEDGWLAATGEALALHVDMTGPRVAPFPADTGAAVAQMQAAHAPLGWPDRAGRGIGIRHRT
jgi:acyl-CoA thioester hydrolase